MRDFGILHYPRVVEPSSVFVQSTLDRLTAFLDSWRQGPGNFGGLHLHACWGESSVLTRGYHGQSVSFTHALLTGSMRLYERTGQECWRRQAAEIVANLLFLGRDGGFIHSAHEYEPGYSNRQTCPIAQGLALLGLIDYYGWAHADSLFRDAIPDTLDRHWKWFQAHFWMNGPKGGKDLDRPGWCGVTNQDLVIVAALARYGRVFGDRGRFEKFGVPVLESYLSPRMYHAGPGLFKRGDAADFVERTSYYTIIVDMLEIIRADAGLGELQAVIDNVVAHVFDAAIMGRDGLQHLAWGADTDKAGDVLGWKSDPLTISHYPAVLPQMARYLARFPDAGKERIMSGLKRTLASYVFSDGTLPTSLRSADPIFEIIPSVSASTTFWVFLINHLGDRLVALKPNDAFVEVCRSAGDLTWRHRRRSWQLSKGGVTLFSGLKASASHVIRGDAALPPHEAGAEVGVIAERIER